MIDTEEIVLNAAVPHDLRLYNEDLAPTSPAQRTWGTYNYIALWFSMSMEVTTYMLASSLIAGGMNWYEAVGTILLGNLIVLIPMLLNAHAGAKYGIPFPVFVRASFGTRGANIPAVLRAIVACGWFGIQSWIGGQSISGFAMIMLFGIVVGTSSSIFIAAPILLFLGEQRLRRDAAAPATKATLAEEP